MTTLTFTDAASTTVGTTALNSLAAGAYSGLLDEVDNTNGSGTCYLNGLVEVVLGADLTCAAGAPYIGLWLVPAPDGTNYPNPPNGTGAIPSIYKVGNIEANPSAVYRRGSLMIPFTLPPMKFKLAVYHALHGSTAWNSSGNVVNLYRWREQGS